MTIQPAVRRTMVVISTVVLAVLLLASSVRATATNPPETAPDAVEYTVAAGDTLWAIAGRHAGPEGDRRQAVDDIRRANGLDGSIVHPGQILLIPTS